MYPKSRWVKEGCISICFWFWVAGVDEYQHANFKNRWGSVALWAPTGRLPQSWHKNCTFLMMFWSSLIICQDQAYMMCTLWIIHSSCEKEPQQNLLLFLLFWVKWWNLFAALQFEWKSVTGWSLRTMSYGVPSTVYANLIWIRASCSAKV